MHTQNKESKHETSQEVGRWEEKFLELSSAQ